MSLTDGRVISARTLARELRRQQQTTPDSAGSAPANGGPASNSNAVNGISGWSLSKRPGQQPAYVLVQRGQRAGAQHLTGTGNLRVSYANSAGSAGSSGYCKGTSENANTLQGKGPGSFVQNSGGLGSLGLSGYTLVNGAWVWIASNASDETIKENIAPTQEDSLTKLGKIAFKQFTFKEEFKDHGAGLQKLGAIAQQLRAIDPQWIVDAPGPLLHPSQYNLLMTALHAIQQLADQVKVLQAKLQSMP